MPNLPAWLIPSDPAPAALRGFTVGAQIGQHRAEQRFREAQMARQEQLAAMDQARWEAQIGMKAAESARRHDAQMQYRQAIEGGMDPLDAMIRFGPEMGQQSSAEAAAIRAMYQKEKAVPTWEVRDLGQGARVLVSDQGGVMNLPGVPKEPAKWETETVTDLEGNPIQVQINTHTGERRSVPSLRQAGFMEQSFADRDELRELQRELRDLDKVIIEAESPGMLYTHGMGKDPEDRSKSELQAIKLHDEQVRQQEELKRQINDLRNKFRGKTTGTTTAPTGGIRVLSIRPKG